VTSDRPDPASSIAQETARLILALQSAASGQAASGQAASEHDTASAECRICPVCQGIAVVRQLRPEAVEHLAAAVSELAQALRELMRPAGGQASTGQSSAEQATESPGSEPDGGSARPDGPAGADRAAGSARAARRAEGVQRIRITD
jgi:hypothetical protein